MQKLPRKIIKRMIATIKYVASQSSVVQNSKDALERVLKKLNPTLLHLDKTQLIELQARRNELRKLFPNSRMCPNCKYGPLINENCNDMMAHRNTHNNNCPRCGHFDSNWTIYPKWDGKLPEETTLIQDEENKDDEIADVEKKKPVRYSGETKEPIFPLQSKTGELEIDNSNINFDNVIKKEKILDGEIRYSLEHVSLSASILSTNMVVSVIDAESTAERSCHLCSSNMMKISPAVLTGSCRCVHCNSMCSTYYTCNGCRVKLCLLCEQKNRLQGTCSESCSSELGVIKSINEDRKVAKVLIPETNSMIEVGIKYVVPLKEADRASTLWLKFQTPENVCGWFKYGAQYDLNNALKVSENKQKQISDSNRKITPVLSNKINKNNMKNDSTNTTTFCVVESGCSLFAIPSTSSRIISNLKVGTKLQLMNVTDSSLDTPTELNSIEKTELLRRVLRHPGEWRDNTLTSWCKLTDNKDDKDGKHFCTHCFDIEDIITQPHWSCCGSTDICSIHKTQVALDASCHSCNFSNPWIVVDGNIQCGQCTSSPEIPVKEKKELEEGKEEQTNVITSVGTSTPKRDSKKINEKLFEFVPANHQLIQPTPMLKKPLVGLSLKNTAFIENVDHVPDFESGF